jgi:hypothetical protein
MAHMDPDTGAKNDKRSFFPVLWIRICVFLGLSDPDPSLFVRIWILILPSKIKKVRRTLISVNFSWFAHLIFEDRYKCTFKI